mmetsp:Transcript_13119/g.18574  ORF Transcript_13119/g.18574 Transcript_13119/m.18574 type:complete len:389 (+) Transcript_13119:147-1313(+)
MGLFGGNKKTATPTSSKNKSGSSKSSKKSEINTASYYQPPKANNDLVEKKDSEDDEMVVMEKAAASKAVLNSGVAGGLQPSEAAVAFDQKTKMPSGTAVAFGKGRSEVSAVTNDGLAIRSEDDASVPTLGYIGSMIARPDPTNPEQLVVGYLLQWKLSAEEGNTFLRFLTFIASIAVICTSVYPFVVDDFGSMPFQEIILAIFCFLSSITLCIIDSRFHCCRSPIGCRAKMRDNIIRHINVLRLVWGRGWFCFVTGLLHMAMEHKVNLLTGGFMTLIGFAMIVAGSYSSHNLSKLRKSLSDNDFLWLEFSRHDYDEDGLIDPSAFATFLAEVGIEFDDLYTLKAFKEIDQDGDQLISFKEFKNWWVECKFDTKRGFDQEIKMTEIQMA